MHTRMVSVKTSRNNASKRQAAQIKAHQFHDIRITEWLKTRPKTGIPVGISTGKLLCFTGTDEHQGS